jgi:hypothetical protein
VACLLGLKIAIPRMPVSDLGRISADPPDLMDPGPITFF